MVIKNDRWNFGAQNIDFDDAHRFYGNLCCHKYLIVSAY